jgi:putative FmdB family regulatory protein
MPTYDYRCAACGTTAAVVQSIGEYCRAPNRPVCCAATMERVLSAVAGLAISNPLAGDRHYEGLASTDGVNIGSRSRHRQYMKDKGVTMASDYRNTWATAQREREKLRSGAPDATLRKELSEIVGRAIEAN